MRPNYSALFYPILLLLLVSACEGGEMPIDARKVLDSLDGPKISTIKETQIEAAKNAEKKGDFKQAIQIYQQMLGNDANNEDIIIALAEVLRRNGDYEKSIAAYNDLLKKDANDIAAKEGKGLTLIAKGDFETPISLLAEVLKADNKRWKSLNAMGILFVTRNLYSDAQKYFEEALRQSPNNVSVLNNLGLAQALNKKLPTAVETLSKASAQSNVDSLSRKRIDLNLALVYASMGKLDEAEKIAKNYLSGVQLDNNLGLYAHLAKDDKLAKSYLNMALTDSKVYYEKAWENLETLGGNKNSADDDAPQKAKLPAKTLKKSTNNAEPDKVPAADNSTNNSTNNSTVQTLGTIKN